MTPTITINVPLTLNQVSIVQDALRSYLAEYPFTPRPGSLRAHLEAEARHISGALDRATIEYVRDLARSGD